MTDEQKYLLKLLREFDDICRKNHIQYFLAGGSAIGAVRHRGVIPWDDDVDIYMRRDEFLKLVDVAKRGEFPENRYLECQELNREYRNVFARYTDVTTCAIHTAQIGTNDYAGEVLDILQLDPVPDSPGKQRRHFKKLLLYTDLINATATFSQRIDCNKLAYLFWDALTKIIGYNRVLCILERSMFSYPEKKAHFYMMRWGGASLIFPKEMYATELQVDIDGITSYIPTMYSDYLIYHYGDEWMFFPKVTEHTSHDAVRSLTHDYRIVRNTYKDVLNRKQLFDNYRNQKKSILWHSKERQEVVYRLIRMRGIILREEILRKIQEENLDLAQMYKNREYGEITALFERYYELQGSSQFSGRDTYIDYHRYKNPVLIELPDEIMEIALKNQCIIGGTGKASRTIEMYAQVKHSIPDNLREIRQFIDLQRKAYGDFSLHLYEEALDKCTELIRFMPDAKEVLKLSIECRSLLNKPVEATRELIKKGTQLFPEDGDFVKYQGDLYFASNKNKAAALYLRARNMTRNGLVLLDIQDKIEVYCSELLDKMRQYFALENYKKANAIYTKINSINPCTPDLELEYMAGMLFERTTQEDAFKYYRRIIDLKNADKNLNIAPQLIKVLPYCGEVPLVSKVRIKLLSLFEMEHDGEMLKREIDRQIIDLQELGLSCYVPELQKLKGDIQRQSGDIKAAYQIYRQCYPMLNAGSLCKRELDVLFAEDIDRIADMRKDEIPVSLLLENFICKFGTRDFYVKYLGEEQDRIKFLWKEGGADKNHE